MATLSAPPRNPHSYHCLCSNLVLATTYIISALPRRAAPSLDKAYILPCPRLPSYISSASAENDDADEAEDSDSDAEADAEVRDYTLLVSLAVPARQPPVVVRREDGFEKRWLLRCGRCKLAVGYRLDWSQFAEAKGEGRRDDVLYLLPGAVLTTEDMKNGKPIEDAEVGFGLAQI